MDIIIIGAGPGGLMAAIAAAGQGGNRVTVLEKNDLAGKKLLVSGAGRCNLTNDRPILDFLDRYGGKDRFVKPALMHFDNRQLVRFFEQRGLRFVTLGNNKIFPRSERSRDILDALLSAVAEAGVSVRYRSRVKAIRVITVDSLQTPRFEVETDVQTYRADRVIVTTGGKSYPSTGSTGDAFDWLAGLGHTIITPTPALTPVRVSQAPGGLIGNNSLSVPRVREKNGTDERFPLSHCAGIAVDMAQITLRRGGRKIAQFEGDLMITHDGFSGPGILDNSRILIPGDELQICWVDSSAALELDKRIIQLISESGKRKVKNALAGLGVPDRLLETLMVLSGIDPDPKDRLGQQPAVHKTAVFPFREYGDCTGITKEQRRKLVRHLRESAWIVDELGDFNEAMVTAGGVKTSEINRNSMESRLVPGLFLAGEIIDVDADTGGFNLQWAFSSGYMAGEKAGGKE